MSSVTGQTPATRATADKLRRLPASAKEDFQLFQSCGDEEALNRLLIAVLADHAPNKAKQLTQWSDATSLIEDLGYDSLAIAEVVFFFEDLFLINISNEEILQLRNLGELRAFVKQKAKCLAA